MAQDAAARDDGSLTIELDCFLPYSTDVVWQALTQAPALSDWLMPTDFVPTVGESFSFRSQAGSGEATDVTGRVLALDPARRLSFSWQAGDVDSVVTFLLIPSSFGTHLCLWQRGLEQCPRHALGALERVWCDKLPVALARHLDRASSLRH
jgi:uncharacterized protein YndB with AHSA1/START domain